MEDLKKQDVIFIRTLFQDERLRLLEIENARKAEKAKLLGPITIVEDHNEKDVQPEHPSKAIGDDDHEWKQFEEHRRQVTHLSSFCLFWSLGAVFIPFMFVNKI